MENRVHAFRLNIDWELIRLISQIDRFDASWTSIEKKEGQSLKQLKSIANEHGFANAFLPTLKTSFREYWCFDWAGFNCNKLIAN